MVEGYPQDTQGKKISAKFLYNTTRSIYEQTGFSYDRPKGQEPLRDAPHSRGRQQASTRSRRVTRADPTSRVGGRLQPLTACRPTRRPTVPPSTQRLIEHAAVQAVCATLVLQRELYAACSSIFRKQPLQNEEAFACLSRGSIRPSTGPLLRLLRSVEQLAYVVAFDRAAQKTDAMTVVDVIPDSDSYGPVVGCIDVPALGNELHHFGWNACSSAFKHEGHNMSGLPAATSWCPDSARRTSTSSTQSRPTSADARQNDRRADLVRKSRILPPAHLALRTRRGLHHVRWRR